ncbi:MAG: UDP-N-acetylmuramoyl-tripeptide--D-alanyl-D-alanine ligase [Desulfotomaculaceae bacterium]|nr:UDP-N-acetylmuramoyl-tripeptide--D-alanyl-D-alanine ligase [Desulfotomaculaceae bacterium]
MRPATLLDIAGATGGEIIQGNPGLTFDQVSIDTRKTSPGDLFLALKGERYDAHNFLAQAVMTGAGGVVVSRAIDIPDGIPAVKVKDTLVALQALARWNRDRCGARLIGVTGSTGKTTTKDMIASVLSTHLQTLKTTGNFNNEIGLPLTLLGMNSSHEAAVVEMGMRGLGEIAALCRIARPDGAVVTNIGETHLELLGSISNIASAKGELLEYMPIDGFAVINAASPYVRREAGRCCGKVIFFGFDQTSDVAAENIRAVNGGSHFTTVVAGEKNDYFLPVPGRHNVLNALAAIAVGLEFGLSNEEINRGLAAVTITGMRQEIAEAGNVKIINDAYNACPASTVAALQLLRELAGDRRMVAVLGNMLELGSRAGSGHREVGEAVAAYGIDCLIAVGDLANGIADGASCAGLPAGGIYRCAGNIEAVAVLDDILRDGDAVLVKGSRGMRMEQIVESLLSTRGKAGGNR